MFKKDEAVSLDDLVHLLAEDRPIHTKSPSEEQFIVRELFDQLNRFCKEPWSDVSIKRWQRRRDPMLRGSPLGTNGPGKPMRGWVHIRGDLTPRRPFATIGRVGAASGAHVALSADARPAGSVRCAELRMLSVMTVVNEKRRRLLLNRLTGV